MTDKKDNIDKELEEIRLRYKERAAKKSFSSGDQSFSFYASQERELVYAKLLNELFPDKNDVKLLEIGAGGGNNIKFFHEQGLQWQHLYANELLPERVEMLKQNVPQANILPGNALELQYDTFFDIVFQSTVFSSILDLQFQQLLADKMIEMTRPGGIIIWYDFIYDNPNNKNVKGISKKVVKQLFNKADSIEFIPVTLAPPIGRRVGKFYNLINKIFPFLRTHVIAVIKV